MLLRLDLMTLRALVIPIARLSDELARDLVDAAAAGDTRLAREATDPVRLHSIRRRVSELGAEWERLRSLVDVSADDLDLVRREAPSYPPEADPISPIEPPPHPSHGGTVFVGVNASNIGPMQSTLTELLGSSPSAELEAGRAAGLEAELALERLRDVVGVEPARTVEDLDRLVPPLLTVESLDRLELQLEMDAAHEALEARRARAAEEAEDTDEVPDVLPPAAAVLEGGEAPPEARGGHVLEQRASLAEIAGVRCFVEGCTRPPVSGELACDWHVGV